MSAHSPVRILSIAGSDPSGGAGIQADLKSIAALGGYGMAVPTALTTQNTQGVSAVHVPPVAFLSQQLDAISADIAIDGVKIGMLANAQVIGAVRNWLRASRPAVVVLDPVMVATSGDRLLDAQAEAALAELIPLVDVLTPNIPELAALAGVPVPANWAEGVCCAEEFAARHGVTLVLKGGHLDGPYVLDALVQPGSEPVDFSAERLNVRTTHGTGCSLSSALATLAAAHLRRSRGTTPQRSDWVNSLAEAKEWLHEAVRRGTELQVGQGHGPVHHFHRWFPPTSLTGEWWEEIEPLREQILALPFLRDMLAGTLAEEDFAYYLAQDALYLRDYSRVLAAASTLAPTPLSQAFFAESARDCILEEGLLHQDWLAGHSRPSAAQPGPVTTSYLNQLKAAVLSGSYGVVAAAVLPCFWLYTWVGQELAALRPAQDANNPYARWLETYADPDFAAKTAQACQLVDEAAAAAGPGEREQMRQAFLAACRHELEFFDAPRALSARSQRLPAWQSDLRSVNA